AVLLLHHPLRPREGHQFVEAGAEVDGATHVDLATRLDLPREQVGLEMRVHGSDLSRVVAVAVMALGKERDRVDVPDLERLLETPLVEPGADPGDQAAGVEVEVNLAETQMMHGAKNHKW